MLALRCDGRGRTGKAQAAGRPGAVGVRGRAKDMSMAGPGLDHEEHIQTAQRNRAIDLASTGGRPPLGG
jgi:hypothetical protein